MKGRSEDGDAVPVTQACTLWRDTQMIDGGTSQESDYKKLKIHNLEDI